MSTQPLPSESWVIRHVRLAHPALIERELLYDIACQGGIVTEIVKSGMKEWRAGPSFDGESGLLLPSLAHAHIHLDKCYILGQCDELIKGDFQEALTLTNDAKEQFPARVRDLYGRGKKMILESVACGVTVMRAYVEVDSAVGFTCLDVGLQLKRNFGHICDVHICVFAQDPLFSGHSDGDTENMKLFADAASRPAVSAIGSAPYVELSAALAKQNIARVLDLAERYHLHADFHLDYNLDPSSDVMLYGVLAQLRARCWTATSSQQRGKRVTIGHATRLALLSSAEWRALKGELADLPVHLVGLPQSDLYMMGRNPDGQLPIRGTLPVPQLARDHGIDVAMAVNNIDNAFTPQGSVDPLMLCPLGVAVFQAATVRDCELLLSSVTIAAKRAIGLSNVAKSLTPTVGDPADFVILHGNASLQSVALNPTYNRTTIKGGVMVAKRRGTEWVLGDRDGS